MTDARVWAGALIWLTALQFYVVEWAASRGFPGYRYTTNAISDLGAVHCHRAVCAPAHTAMNTSFVLLGAAIALGGLLLARELRGVRWLAGPAGAGVIVVGLFPEDTISPAHGAGAAVFFVAGNAGLILTGRRLAAQRRRVGAAMLVVWGCVGLVATGLFATGGFGLVDAVGSGAVERSAGYPVSAGYALAGLTVLVGSWRSRARPARSDGGENQPG